MSDSSIPPSTLGRAFGPARDTASKLVRETSKRARETWPILFVAFGGVLTLAWIGFLLWAAFKLLE